MILIALIHHGGVGGQFLLLLLLIQRNISVEPFISTICILHTVSGLHSLSMFYYFSSSPQERGRAWNVRTMAMRNPITRIFLPQSFISMRMDGREILLQSDVKLENFLFKLTV